MGSTGTRSQAFISLKNNDKTNGLEANSIIMDANYQYISTRYTIMSLNNYHTFTNVKYLANEIIFEANTFNPDCDRIWIHNYFPKTNKVMANKIEMDGYESGYGSIGIYNYNLDGTVKAGIFLGGTGWIILTEMGTRYLLNFNNGYVRYDIMNN